MTDTATGTTAPTRWQNRIIGEGMEDPEQLLAHPGNWRIHPKAQQDALAAVLDEVGFVQRVIVNQRTQHVVDGHLRVQLAISKGEPEIPVIYVDLSEQEENAVLAVLDPISAMAGTDREKLQELLGAVRSDDARMLELLGSIRETNRIVDTATPGRTDPEAAPAKRKSTKIKLGDLFQLGDHKLLCGDCTKPEHVARLMGKSKAVLMNTDPPYGIAYDSAELHDNKTEYAAIEKDDLVEGEKLQAFLEAAIRAAVPALVENAAFYLWHPMLTQGTFFAAAAAAAADILIHRQIVWVKPQLIFGRGDYHWQHELCFYGWRRGKRPDFVAPRNQVTVWQIGYEEGRNEREHPTQKPVELFRRPILNHTKQGQIVYEPFAGSGPQFIAAQELQRKCYGIEIDPIYCQVIIDRWEQFTEQKAERIERAEAQPSKGKPQKAKSKGAKRR